jgi:hypothetical protein
MGSGYRWAAGLGTAEIATLLMALPLLAQQPQQAPASPLPEVRSEADNKQGSETKEPVSPKDDRLFWTLPNYLTVENASHVPPLTTGQKYKLVAQQSFDPVQFPYVGFLALLGQMSNSEPAFRQGAAGYAKRYGTEFADITIANFVTGALLPSIFRQDPRYFQLGAGSFFHRFYYAASRIVITRTDSGHNQVNYSEIAGNAVAAAIANAYHPAPDRTAINSVSVWWTQIGLDAMANEGVEFWPDIRRKVDAFRHKHL